MKGIYVKVDYGSKNSFKEQKACFDENVYEKLKEAELEMDNTSKRYSKEEILDSINNIIEKLM